MNTLLLYNHYSVVIYCFLNKTTFQRKYWFRIFLVQLTKHNNNETNI